MKIIQLDKDVLFNEWFGNPDAIGVSKATLNGIFDLLNEYLREIQQNDPAKLKQAKAAITTARDKRSVTRALLKHYAITHTKSIAIDSKAYKLRNIAKAIGRNDLTVRLVLNEVAAEHNIVIGNKLRDKIPELLQLLIEIES